MNQGMSVGSRPGADNDKNLAGAVAYFAPGIAGVAQVVTPVGGAQESVVIRNTGGDFVRVRVNFAAGITPVGSATQAVLVPPGDAWQYDGADHEGDAAIGLIKPIASVTITPVAVPAGAVNAVVEVSTLTATSPAQTLGGIVVCNFASS